MSVNRIGPPCPECGSLTTDVISTCRNETQEFLRRRKCPICEHRFSTVQRNEVVVKENVWPNRSVAWKGRKFTINWELING
jgi:transcriptional regulator NrdR family protein